MRPSVALERHRDAVLALIAGYRVTNPRVFGSVVAGTDTEDSDLDLLVDALPGTTLFDLGDLYGDLQDLLGVRVDLATPGDLSRYIRDRVVASARPL